MIVFLGGFALVLSLAFVIGIAIRIAKSPGDRWEKLFYLALVIACLAAFLFVAWRGLGITTRAA